MLDPRGSVDLSKTATETSMGKTLSSLCQTFRADVGQLAQSATRSTKEFCPWLKTNGRVKNEAQRYRKDKPWLLVWQTKLATSRTASMATVLSWLQLLSFVKQTSAPEICLQKKSHPFFLAPFIANNIRDNKYRTC